MPAERKCNIVIPGDDPPQMQGSPHLARLERYGAVTLYTDRPETFDEKIRRVQDADIIINSRGIVKWPGEALRLLPKLRMVSTCSIGTDMFDLEAAREMGIVICNQPGRTAPVVAEHAFGLMFSLAKRAAFFTSAIKTGAWPRIDSYFLQGKTLGVVGTGNIGMEMARLGRAIGMNVVAWSYHPDEGKAGRAGFTYVPLEQLYAESDVISLHVRLTDDSRHIIDRTAIAAMKPGVLLVNCGRAGLLDTEAMIAGLHSGHLGGAAIDVFDQEPVPPDHPLLACEQVILTPHCADMTPEGVDLLNEGAVNNVIAYLEGKPQNVVG